MKAKTNTQNFITRYGFTYQKSEKSIKVITTSELDNNRLFTKIKEISKFLRPAFVVSVAYIDLGNFPTNYLNVDYRKL